MLRYSCLTSTKLSKLILRVVSLELIFFFALIVAIFPGDFEFKEQSINEETRYSLYILTLKIF